MSGEEKFLSKKDEKKPSKNDIEKFKQFLSYLAEEIAEGYIERSPSPCTITKKLVNEDAHVELSIELGEREPVNDEPDFTLVSDNSPIIDGMELCLSEIEIMDYSDEYDYMLISHMISIENGSINYSLVHYLINEIDDITVRVEDPDAPGYKEKKTWSKQEQTAQSLLINSEPKITKERLDYIISKTREVVDSNSSYDE